MKNRGTTSLHFLFLIEDRPRAIAAQSGRPLIRDHIAWLACGLASADINVTQMPLVAGPVLVRFQAEAEVRRQAKPADSVENDP
jgi:hypothetical protein